MLPRFPPLPPLSAPRTESDWERARGGDREDTRPSQTYSHQTPQSPAVLINILVLFPRLNSAEDDELRVQGAAPDRPQRPPLRLRVEEADLVFTASDKQNRWIHRLQGVQVKTTSPKKYCVRPNNGIVAPRSTFDVLVTMQAQREAPPDMQCRDKFLVQTAVVSRDTTPKDISGDMFTKESGNVVDEVRLKVVYAPPSQPPSINEGSDQESLGSLSYQETTRELAEPETITSESEPFASIPKLKERNSAVQPNNKLPKELREELDLLRREISRQNRCFSLVFVLVVAILGILVVYLMNRPACVTM